MSAALRRFLRAAIAAPLAVLAACGNAPNEGADFRRVASQYIAGRVAPEAAAEDLPSRAVLDAFPAPLIRVTIPTFGVSSILGIAETNGAYVTWLSTDRTAFILRGGMLTGTRGLLQNLLAARVPDVRSASGQVRREHFYSGDNERSERAVYACDVTTAGRETLAILGRAYTARRVVERCKMDTGNFENIYWVEGSGKIRKSRQWVGPKVGYVTIEAVNR